MSPALHGTSACNDPLFQNFSEFAPDCHRNLLRRVYVNHELNSYQEVLRDGYGHANPTSQERTRTSPISG